MDEEIRTLIEQRDLSKAFNAIMHAYQHKVFRLAYSFVGIEAADEVTQVIFIRIWKALPGFRGDSALATWIYAIARNACLTALNRQPARTSSLEDAHVRAIAERPSLAPQRSIDVALLLAQLPDKDRQVLTLFYLQERSYEDIAEMLDLPMGTVKTYLHRAKKELAARAAIMMGKGAL